MVISFSTIKAIFRDGLFFSLTHSILLSFLLISCASIEPERSQNNKILLPKWAVSVHIKNKIISESSIEDIYVFPVLEIDKSGCVQNKPVLKKFVDSSYDWYIDDNFSVNIRDLIIRNIDEKKSLVSYQDLLGNEEASDISVLTLYISKNLSNIEQTETLYLRMTVTRFADFKEVTPHLLRDIEAWISYNDIITKEKILNQITSFICDNIDNSNLDVRFICMLSDLNINLNSSLKEEL